ncbi:MAG: quinone-dependent dihydroorotate dehydrogenase [Balneolales bacterium]
MKSLYKAYIRPVLFRIQPERIHNLALRVLSVFGRFNKLVSLANTRFTYHHSKLVQTIADIRFDNPVGLAAGFDKNGHAIEMLGGFGFGHIEIGSVSAYPSKGNPPPRLFRIPKEHAIVVSYGVPNDGAEVVATRLNGRNPAVPLGINLVKTNDATRPNTDEEVLLDYTLSFKRLQHSCSYINLNMSCPNSANDRDFFDEPSRIHALLERLSTLSPSVPVFLKLKPVRDDMVLRKIVEIADEFPFIAGFEFNLPAGKPAELVFTTPREKWVKYPGAVSGRPVEQLMNANLKMLYKIIGRDSRFKMIAAGGIFSAEDAYRKIRLGASLVQLYTAMVYEGPGIVKEINQGLVKLLERDGFAHISEAVGADHLKN